MACASDGLAPCQHKQIVIDMLDVMILRMMMMSKRSFILLLQKLYAALYPSFLDG